MRAAPTEAEYVLWTELRANQLGVRFRQQYPTGHFIVDFACVSHLLAVEVDGPIHEDEEAQAYDQRRTEALNAVGFTVMRFTNHEVLHELTRVCQDIRDMIAVIDSARDEQRPSKPRP